MPHAFDKLRRFGGLAQSFRIEGDAGVRGVREVVKTHEHIDAVADQYIRLARLVGKWCWLHDARKGRLDNHGVFHFLESDCCPASGEVVLDKPADQTKFDKISLAAYRRRIADLHADLDRRISEVESRNSESGWTVADAKFEAARERKHATWREIRSRATQGKLSDVLTICRHQENLLEREWRVERALGKAGRGVEAVMAEQRQRAQDIVWSIANRRVKGGAK